MVFKAVSEKIDFDAVKESTTLTGEALAKKQARDKELEAIIKGDNIPEPGIPESFKVLLKELQSLALDVRVLRDDNTEVKIMESVDYGDTNLNHIIEGDRYSDREDERFGDYGFSKKEFDGEEMVDVEEDEEEDAYLDLDESSDDDM